MRLAHEFPITRQGILKHLDVLAAAGLVRIHTKDREKMYSLTPQPFTHVNMWIELIGKQRENHFQPLKNLVEDESV